MSIISGLYLSVFVVSLITFFDVLIKFKRPLILKFYLLLLCISLSFQVLIYAIDAVQFAYTIAFLKTLIAVSFLNFFSFLYFQKFRIIVTSYSIVMVIFSLGMMWYNYAYYYENLIHLKSQGIGFESNQNSNLPFYFQSVRLFFVSGFISLIIYFWYTIFTKFDTHNFYFRRIKVWTNFIFGLCVTIILVNLPLEIYKTSHLVGHIGTLIIYMYALLIILYRPNFLNRASLKISLGEKFNQDAGLVINEFAFTQHFFTNFYFLKPEASMEDLAIKLNVSSNDLYKFIYNKYSLTFNDLVNKNRVEYLVDLIQYEKYKLYTIDALAREAGFSSRHHLYKPFKKFHGGNPSDLLSSTAS